MLLSPITIPAPLALIIIIVFAVALYGAARSPRTAPAAARQPAAPPTPPVGRHRLDTVTNPYRPRDWVTVTAERPVVDLRPAGLPDRELVETGPLRIGVAAYA